VTLLNEGPQEPRAAMEPTPDLMVIVSGPRPQGSVKYITSTYHKRKRGKAISGAPIMSGTR
jgi:hypothetical protein